MGEVERVQVEEIAVSGLRRPSRSPDDRPARRSSATCPDFPVGRASCSGTSRRCSPRGPRSSEAVARDGGALPRRGARSRCSASRPAGFMFGAAIARELDARVRSGAQAGQAAAREPARLLRARVRPRQPRGPLRRLLRRESASSSPTTCSRRAARRRPRPSSWNAWAREVVGLTLSHRARRSSKAGASSPGAPGTLGADARIGGLSRRAAQNKMAGEKILVVDDDDDILLIVQTILGGAGYSAHTARNGREGVEMALELRPDLILLDVMMPELSGWEVCTTLKNAPETRQVPIAMLTVKNEIRDLITGMQAGADDYITKPFTRRKLLSTVQKLLESGDEARRPTFLTSENEEVRFKNLLFDPGHAAADGPRHHRRPARPAARQPRPRRPLRGRRAVQPHRGRLRLGGLRRAAARDRAGAAADARHRLRDRGLRRRQPGRAARTSTSSRASRPATTRWRGCSARRGRSRSRCAGTLDEAFGVADPQADRRLRRPLGDPLEPADARRAARVPGAARGDHRRLDQGRGAAVDPARDVQGHPAPRAHPDGLPADLQPLLAGALRARGADARPARHGLREPGAPLRVRRRERDDLGARAALPRLLGLALPGARRAAALHQRRGGLDRGALLARARSRCRRSSR